ncbi:D-hexose-6-phosphate mutarotase [Sulfurimonas marina]|uniref:Putative glucose-6-phosphate 1-epimerase n=1 Tax=Sulfurimonas marina TaxID=2590551 RepID=A0A7M1AXH1_9BACT|nr:D-hexose-6-phosphate mutarotase [Sulfurimonas marina]QOP42161.1 D-hexose-6-phosphate mutarotase [Sulfurimonas marina]
MIKKLQNGFEYVEISNKAAIAKIALQGAHLFHYERSSEIPLLWLSDASKFELGTAIRGGVPICWPSFGNNNPKLPQHGFARTVMWQLGEIQELDEDTTQLRFSLEDSKESRELWDYKFLVELTIRVGKTLEMELKTTNCDNVPFTITQALHTYFNVSAIEDVTIEGLEGKKYLDALTLQHHTQVDEIRFSQEVDRVYQGVEDTIILKDANREIELKNSGSKSVVVWNPWIDKCARMSGMKPDAYKEFVCIESANAYEDKREILPNKSHTIHLSV